MGGVLHQGQRSLCSLTLCLSPRAKPLCMFMLTRQVVEAGRACPAPATVSDSCHSARVAGAAASERLEGDCVRKNLRRLTVQMFSLVVYGSMIVDSLVTSECCLFSFLLTKRNPHAAILWLAT